MPAFIRRADVRAEHLELPILRQLKRHFLVVATWADMKAVIKAAMISHSNFFLKITSDREIRDVYVGSKSKANKVDQESLAYNSLEDLMDPPDLCIIKLNELSYKNKAASGALEEAIAYRLDRDKPTWLFSDMDKPFTVGSHAYSDAVAELMKTSFKIQKVPRIVPENMSIDDLYESMAPAEVSSPSATSYGSPGASTNSAFVSPKISDSLVGFSPEPTEPVVTRKQEFTKPRLKIKPSEDTDANDVSISRYGSGIKTSNSFSNKRK